MALNGDQFKHPTTTRAARGQSHCHSRQKWPIGWDRSPKVVQLPGGSNVWSNKVSFRKRNRLGSKISKSCGIALLTLLGQNSTLHRFKPNIDHTFGFGWIGMHKQCAITTSRLLSVLYYFPPGANPRSRATWSNINIRNSRNTDNRPAWK